jgi:hypothetical protein
MQAVAVAPGAAVATDATDHPLACRLRGLLARLFAAQEDLQKRLNRARTFENFNDPLPLDSWTVVEDWKTLLPATLPDYYLQSVVTGKRLLWTCFPRFYQCIEDIPAPRDVFRRFVAPVGIPTEGRENYYQQLEAYWKTIVPDLWQAAECDHNIRPEWIYGFLPCTELEAETKTLVRIIEAFREDKLDLTMRWYGHSNHETEIVHVLSLAIHDPWPGNPHWFVRVRFNWPNSKGGKSQVVVAVTLQGGQYVSGCSGLTFGGTKDSSINPLGFMDLSYWIDPQSNLVYDSVYHGLVPNWILTTEHDTIKPDEAVRIAAPSLRSLVIEHTLATQWETLPPSKKRAFLLEMGLDLIGSLKRERDEEEVEQIDTKRPRFMTLGE